jgi:transcriptional regulator with XRE-family HTH domain
MTQEDLAAQSGLSVNNIRNWEQGQRTPGVLAVYQLAKALGVPMERFVEGIEPAPEPSGQKEKAKGKARGKRP